MKQRILLVAAKTGYQVREFYGAAERLGIELVLATDRCHILDDPWGDHATALQFDAPSDGIAALEARGPFDGILAVGDQPAYVAACCAERLGLRFHPPEAASAASDKFLTKERFREAHLNVPEYRLLAAQDATPPLPFPCVLKPLHLSASRGVIRANDAAQFAHALGRIRKMTGEQEPVLVEQFIPGREFALEGVVTGGRLQVLALFDKPDPLDGPYFEETIYITPSQEPGAVQSAIAEAAQRAAAALGFTHGPVHAEMRVNPSGVWMLEAAARPIGGLCSRVLEFATPAPDQTMPLEELLLRHALGQDVSAARLAPGSHGVMMIPIPLAGVFSGVGGLEQARQTADITSVEITAKVGQRMEPLPEGASYLGFLFSHAARGAEVERALRRAHAALEIHVARTLLVV
jgi:biotin carboxylase